MIISQLFCVQIHAEELLKIEDDWWGVIKPNGEQHLDLDK